ncbi:hypothetical protein LCGC14_1355410 [marine sediment metagenome]|uniref:Uncharacterized protein n=1 Tax=marine sediment metagenome TaxID=412755 RepID=A0A0F9NBZ6_9ZZZZ
MFELFMAAAATIAGAAYAVVARVKLNSWTLRK